MDEREYQLTDCQMRLEVMQDRCQRIETENARLREESRRLRDELELLENSAFNEPIERDYPHGE